MNDKNTFESAPVELQELARGALHVPEATVTEEATQRREEYANHADGCAECTRLPYPYNGCTVGSDLHFAAVKAAATDEDVHVLAYFMATRILDWWWPLEGSSRAPTPKRRTR